MKTQKCASGPKTRPEGFGTVTYRCNMATLCTPIVGFAVGARAPTRTRVASRSLSARGSLAGTALAGTEPRH